MFYFILKLAKRIRMCFFRAPRWIRGTSLKWMTWKAQNGRRNAQTAPLTAFFFCFFSDWFFYLSQIFHFIPLWVFKWLNKTFTRTVSFSWLSFFKLCGCVCVGARACVCVCVRSYCSNSAQKHLLSQFSGLVKCFNFNPLIRKAAGW